MHDDGTSGKGVFNDREVGWPNGLVLVSNAASVTLEPVNSNLEAWSGRRHGACCLGHTISLDRFLERRALLEPVLLYALADCFTITINCNTSSQRSVHGALSYTLLQVARDCCRVVRRKRATSAFFDAFREWAAPRNRLSESSSGGYPHLGNARDKLSDSDDLGSPSDFGFREDRLVHRVTDSGGFAYGEDFSVCGRA